MDALILSCGTGGGHDAAGRAMQAALEQRGHRVTMMNPYQLQSEQLVRTINQAYIQLAKNAPAGFGAVYQAANLYRRLPVQSPIYYANQAMNQKMQAFLDTHHFDVVLMPHLFPAEIMTNLKRHGGRVPRTILIATDYTCIPFMEETECDAYVAPAEDLTAEFAARGIPEERIYPLGIPVHPDFEKPVGRKEAMRMLGLDSDRRYILVSGGSMGAGHMEDTLKIMLRCIRHNPKLRLIVICGSNEKLYRNLLDRYFGQMEIVGRTSRMPLYLKASALYVTKAGGLSSTEAAVMGVPLLHVSPIPGCETCNARYFEERAMSMEVQKPTPQALSRALQLLGRRDLREIMVESQHDCIPAGAAGRIADLAEQLAGERRGRIVS